MWIFLFGYCDRGSCGVDLVAWILLGGCCVWILSCEYCDVVVVAWLLLIEDVADVS